MIKSELIDLISSKITHLPEKKIAESINYLIDLMGDTLSEHQRIEIRGFGSFSLHHRAPRNAHNPKTGVKVVTEAKYIPHFKPGKTMRQRVDASRKTYAIKDDD